MHIAARAPNHLGDGVLALPAMHALARRGRLTIHGPRWAADLYRDVPAEVVGRTALRGDVAVLFAPSLRAAVEARNSPRRIGTPTDRRGWLLTDRVAPGIHPRETYAALVAVLGAAIDGPPRWTPRAADPQPDVPDGHVGLNPVTGVGPIREWPGFAELARRIGAPVVVYGGPGERDRVLAVAGGRPVQVGLPLPAFARALVKGRVFVSNDSGAAHFAAACGARVIVVHGPTAPRGSAPHGASAVRGPALPCAPCWRATCPYDRGCLDIPVETVLAEVHRA